MLEAEWKYNYDELAEIETGIDWRREERIDLTVKGEQIVWRIDEKVEYSESVAVDGQNRWNEEENGEPEWNDEPIAERKEDRTGVCSI